MAKIGAERKVSLHLDDGDASLFFRQPTNEELNNYFAKGLELQAQAKDKRANLVPLRVQMFDSLLVRVENLEDQHGNSLDHEGAKAAILEAHKSVIVVRLIEEGVSFDIKN